ncbi:MAG: alkyl hydroperoxide reductase [Chloroflexi bacterium]|nr:alkyl hydroperoxide reductase [Chloroflexota bacterium]MDA1271222.1 alkyl hydroperoxide reductase [Chloroflexota bacterium]PKB59633.1 MAG: alkyl hydroperoxide reductase [SAR202 cluster bacterium Casp-Chloro-G2]
MRKLENKYANELAVIGVHTAKFPNEKDTGNLASAVRRYELEHPVINDSEFQVWQQYSCRAWPTLMFIDPQGNVIGKHEGEMSYDAFDGLLGKMLAEFDAQGLLNHEPLPSKFRSAPETLLSFPGKVLADGPSGRLFIADTNHNRVVVTSLDGAVRDVIGSGQEGLTDGDLAGCAFNHPQGMALDGETLYVADTENHAIRKIDLGTGKLATIAGTGEQGHTREGTRPGRTMELSSPFDLVHHNGILYIAMAGIHQLWSMDLDSGMAGPFAGNGKEAITDGPLANAELAQPCGIATDGVKLYFADSETSSVRSADINPAGKVQTIVGLDLFVFGDVDGSDHRVRLQHPIGIAHHDGVIYIADTYNHKIKRVLPATRSAFTVLGTGAFGHTDGAAEVAQFSEPSGISFANGKMYIADTNNHAIRVADVDSGEVSTFEITGL